MRGLYIPCVVLETTASIQLFSYQQIQHNDVGITMPTQAEFVFASAEGM